MEGTMTRATARPLSFGAAFGRQFKLLWTSRRPLLLGVALLALLVLAGEPWSQDPKARLLTFWPLWLTLIGPVWAVAVFHDEGPSKRLYLWSLPVHRAQHTLARLAAGVAWLWILYGVLIAAGALMAAMDGQLWQLGLIDVAGWINFFSGPLLGYLAVSILTVGSDFPLRWFFGILFLFPLLLSTLKEWLGLDRLADAILRPVAHGDWGLFPVMVGGLGGSVMELEHAIAALDPLRSYSGQFEVAYWATATPLWILFFGVLVALMASRHPDTLPRLRRPR